MAVATDLIPGDTENHSLGQADRPDPQVDDITSLATVFPLAECIRPFIHAHQDIKEYLALQVGAIKHGITLNTTAQVIIHPQLGQVRVTDLIQQQLQDLTTHPVSQEKYLRLLEIADHLDRLNHPYFAGINGSMHIVVNYLLAQLTNLAQNQTPKSARDWTVTNRNFKPDPVIQLSTQTRYGQLTTWQYGTDRTGLNTPSRIETQAVINIGSPDAIPRRQFCLFTSSTSPALPPFFAISLRTTRPQTDFDLLYGKPPAISDITIYQSTVNSLGTATILPAEAPSFTAMLPLAVALYAEFVADLFPPEAQQ